MDTVITIWWVTLLIAYLLLIPLLGIVTRFLRHARAPCTRKCQKHGGKQGECERIAIGGSALRRMAKHECDRCPERCDLRQRQVDKNHFANQDHNAEIGVDPHQAHRHQEGRPEKLQGIDHRMAAAVRASTLASNSEM